MEKNPSSTLYAIQESLLARELSCVQLLDSYLKKAKSIETLNAYVELFETSARKKAEEIDQRIMEGRSLGKLFGLIISIKDNISYEGHLLTAGSKILGGFTAQYTATGLKRLLEEDAIVIGRTNCDEFGMGSTNEHSYYGPAKNGFDPSLVSGGSSGGAAVSVQMDTCMAALGTDTGGSVRQPAAYCGVMGYKPAYGRISRFGLVAYASSFDQLGIIAKSADIIALMMSIMAGADDLDATSLQGDIPSYTQPKLPKSPKIAYIDGIFSRKGMDKSIRQASLAYIAQLKQQGCTVESVAFRLLDYMIPTYYILTTAEASTNLSRYDGVRYGYRAASAKNLEDTYIRTRSEGFGEEVKRRVLLGTYVLSAGYYEAYFAQAQRVRRLIKNELEGILKEFDYLIMPVAPNYPRTIGTKTSPVTEYLSDIFTVLANLTGAPALSLPINNTLKNSPISVQFMAQKGRESTLFNPLFMSH